jgi:hypothetical protein
MTKETPTGRGHTHVADARMADMLRAAQNITDAFTRR